MRLGGATSGVDPLVMGSGNDYAELSDLGPSRWSSRGYHPPHSSVHHPTSASSTHIRSNSFEAEDIVGPYGNTRIANSTSSLRGRSGLCYSPPGTSYTIVERPHSPHYYYNTAGAPLKSGSLPGRGTYLGSSTHVPSGAGTVPSSTRHNGKKQPLSPEQVIRMFGTTTSSSSVPMSYRYSNGTRDRGRRSPASSPPSTTHQVYRERERDRSIPNISELTTRTVTMSRDQQDGHGFGICVKAGKEPGVGVYISRIEEGSMAERANLRPGDTILEVNGTPFTSINHDEALKRCVQILKSSRQISMTVRSPPSSLNSAVPMQGFGPQISALRDSYAQPFRQTCSWMDRHGPASPPMEYGGRRHERRDRIKRVELLIEPGQSLGLMIRGGVEYGLGIFITGVDKDSVADRAGLMIGDQILEVNSQSFLDVTHDEAVSQLKYHKRMSLLVRDVGKVPHSCTSIEPEPWDTYSPTGTRSRKKCPISAMVEEKARSLLPRHHFASLSYYITEYGARGMTIDAFVAVLLEMLDTSEKHSLVTEIRELAYPEDRTKYDELVYRRDTYLTDRDRHRRKGEHGHPHDLPVSDADLEVMVATSSAPTDDIGTSDIRHRTTTVTIHDHDEEAKPNCIEETMVRVVTSVSVIQHGEEPPKFSDAIGKLVPRPLVPPQVASPINLLNPDRYEFYTFNDSGDLVKRLMTMKEIQSIVAGGSNEGSVMHHMGSSNDKNFDNNVEDIVTSVQKVLNEEVEAKKNATNEHNVLDTPDVSSTWSIILPAIFGNTGDDIRPHKPQIVMTPDSVIVDATEKTATNTVDVKVKPSNTGSLNKIEDSTEKKNAVKPTTVEEPIVHITKKKPVNATFEASTPRSSVGGYHEHSIDELHSHHNNSFHGYRRKTTPAPAASTTENDTKAPKPTRFVTRRPITPHTQEIQVVTTIAPELEDATTEQSTRIPTKDATTEVQPEKATEKIAEISTVLIEEAPVVTTNVSDLEPFTTDATTDRYNAELTTYKQEYDESTTQQVAEETTAETEHVEHAAATTEYSTLFDSSNSFNQIVESLKDTVSSESVVMITESNESAAQSTLFDDLTTTESFMVEEDHTTEKIPSIDIAQRINQSNVYLNEEMFVDEQEPLVYDIPTTTDYSVDTTEFNEETTNKYEDLTLPVFEEVKLQYPESSSIFEEKNPIVQQVDNFIHENTAKIADSWAIESTNTENKVANVVALENLTLSEFIGQAATVASVLSNDADNMPIKAIVNQLLLSPQLKHDELAPTTNIPANFHEMEVLSSKTEASPVSSDDTDDVSYETSVIKETSSISMGSKQPVEKLSKKPEFAIDATKNEVKSDLFKIDSDASTEISVESDVHEEMNMVKLKIPSKVGVSSADSALNENIIPGELATATEMNREISTLRDESSTLSAQTTENIPSEGTTVEHLDDLLSTTENHHIESFDQTTLLDDTDSASETINHPTENQSISGNFVSDILNSIGMIDEDVIAQKFNISLSDELEDEDIAEMFHESTTEINEKTTAKSKNEQTTMYNHYKEEMENEIIKRLQDTLEERLNPKTERIEILETSHTTDSSIVKTTGSPVEVMTSSPVEVLTGSPIEGTTDSSVEITTGTFERLEVNTIRESDTATETEGVPHSTDENPIVLSQNENTETTTEVNDETGAADTTELSNVLNDQNNHFSTDETNMNQDELTTIAVPTTGLYPKDEEAFIKLGETTILPVTQPPPSSENDVNTHSSIIKFIPSKKPATLKIDDRTSGISKPSQYFRPHTTDQKLFYVNTAKPSLKMPPSANTLKIKVSNSNRRPIPVTLDPAPKQALGLEQSTIGANADILEFTKLCNELAFTFWKSLTSEGISSARSLVISPFALTSMLAMIFLGARGSTSGEMNEMLRLDDMVTFNPHRIFRNITDSVENTKDGGIANTAFVRELFSDRSKGKILSFFKDKAQQFYSGHVEEVNFNVINDVIRRRTNLLVKRHTWSKITEYIKTNNVWLNPPLAGLSANIFQTDCSKATVNERDGEMFFQVLPAIRQRRLVPIPAAVYKSGSGFMAGYEPEVDATAVAFGGTDVVSTIFVMPGQQGHSAPGDNLERLESVFMTNAVTNNAWRRLLTTLMPRPGLEVQIPRFSHRSFINATYGLQKMGLNELFDFDKADLRGLTGSTTRDMYISDMIQINTFSTCAEEKIGDQHHVELYPAPPIQQRNINYQESLDGDYEDVSVSSVSSDEERSLYDPLFDDQKY